MKRLVFLVVILVMSIGTAIVSTVLYINSGVKIGMPEDGFQVYFTDAILDTTNIYKSSISEDRKTITFSTELKSLNEESVLNYEIINNSTSFSADISMNCTPSNDYLQITNTLDKNEIEAKELVNGSLKIKLKKVSTEEKEFEVSCTIDAIGKETSVIKEAPKLDVALEANGGNITNTTIKLPLEGKVGELPVPTKAGYGFIGWYSSDEDDAILITSDSNVTKFFPETLYAKYEPGKYTVTFNANGGSVNVDNKVVQNTYAYGELPKATKSEALFTGWYTDVNAGNLVTSDTIVNLTSTQVLYARYASNSGYLVSENSGDYVLIGTRKWTRTTSEKVVFLRMYTANDKTSGGYAVASTNPDYIVGESNTSSKLTTPVKYTSQTGKDVYIAFMTTPFSVSGSSSVTASVNGEEKILSTWTDPDNTTVINNLAVILYD